jgi:hypothetical protein
VLTEVKEVVERMGARGRVRVGGWGGVGEGVGGWGEGLG